MKKYLGLVILFIIIGGIVLIKFNKKEIQTYNYFYFDTAISIEIYDNAQSEVVEKEIEKILKNSENKFSTYKTETEISKINSGLTNEMSNEFKQVLTEALQGCKFSQGSYDPALGNLINLWDVTSREDVPSEVEIEKAQEQSGCENIVIKGNTIKLNKNIKLDFGSIAKGQVADKLQQYLTANDYNGIINLGGNVTIVGTKPNDIDFEIGIKDPRLNNNSGGPVISIRARDKTASTSGVYERYFEVDGTIYHHIINPKTGYPVDSDLTSVTIISASGIEADMLSTAIFVMGLEKGMKYIEEETEAEAIIIDKDNNVYTSKGTKDIKILNDDFTKKAI